LTEAPNRKLILGELHDKDGRVIDSCCAIYTRGPHSYTGEDTVEFHCHGSPAVLAAGLEALYIAGAKPAKRGEFTKRAFLNGKLGLTEAEAVIDLIEADTAEAAANAAGQVGGRLQKQLEPIYDDLVNLCSRFEKKLHDLELTRMVSVQMGPQTRLLQNNDTLMIEKIQSSLVNTIPLWKSQMVLALGLAHTENAMKAQRAVTDLTNDLLTKNAEKLHMATVETAKEAERGMVDIETLKHTNKLLIDTMDEVLEIQQQGKEKRRAAEQELATIEGELRAKIMEMR
jgi:hypothetical protein